MIFLRHLILKLITVVLMLMIISLCGHWLMQQIPGSTSDLNNFESDNFSNQNEHAEVQPTIPLFYWSFIPKFSKEELSAPDKIPFSKKWPDWRWNGKQNIYHQWLFHSSISMRDSRPVYLKISEAISWTLMLQLPAVLLILFLGFWLAEWSVRTANKRLSNALTIILTAFHSIPSFWLASMLLILFSGKGFLNILPSSFISSENSKLFEFWTYKSYYLILPLIAIVLPSLSVVYNLIRNNIITNMQLPFWRRLMSIGIPVKDAIKQEIRPLSTIPILAWIASAIPLLISGSIIIENIFSIPGTGRLLLQSISYRDWPVVHGLMMTASLLTILGIQLANYIQSRVDPRIGMN